MTDYERGYYQGKADAMKTREPVAWEQFHEHMAGPFYKAPRPWVGLTEGEVKECFKVTPDLFLPWHIYARIEAKLKEKNT